MVPMLHPWYQAMLQPRDRLHCHQNRHLNLQLPNLHLHRLAQSGPEGGEIGTTVDWPDWV